MHVPSSVTESLGWLAYEFTQLQPFIPTYIHLILSALLPIYTGAHSSLSRPSSAAKSKKSKDGKLANGKLELEPRRMEGLTPGDAIMLPILAGTTLAGLYFLIQWLQDPEILSKILNWYFASFSIFSVANMFSDGLDVFHSILFPYFFVDQGTLFEVDVKQHIYVPSVGSNIKNRMSPFPGVFSRLPLPERLQQIGWYFHVLPSKKLLVFKGYLHSVFSFNFDVGIHGIEGFTVALIAVFYYNFVDKPWWLTNLMGFGFCYGALNLMSPTTFMTGTLILSALFFYDIYFVFFTPMMVTVAKSLDIPIKLLFPRPADADAPPGTHSLSMLGLGDIVLPGIMVGLALRFDLYIFYLRQQSKIPKTKSAVEPDIASQTVAGQTITEVAEDESNPDSVSPAGDLHKAPHPDSDNDQQFTITKAEYVSVDNSWGDRFWTQSMLGKSRFSDKVPGLFPKPYFIASMIGYIIGMMCTLLAMQISNHAQPALLYLVPSVLLSIWATGLLRDELRDLWNFSDAPEEEKKNEKVNNSEKTETEAPDSKGSIQNGTEQELLKTTKSDSQKKAPSHLIFSFSVAFSPPTESTNVVKLQSEPTSTKSRSVWQPSLSSDGHADKRLKVQGHMDNV